MDMSKDGILGEGTSCICRRGRVLETGELVAIKVYKPSESSFSAFNHQTCLMKHKRSIAVLQRLQEPFTRPTDPKLWNSLLDHAKPAKLFMQLLDYSKDAFGQPGWDTVDDELYVVTELAQYSLKDYISKQKRKSTPPSKETVRIITEAVVLAMAGLHSKGFVHLDMKPENLMMFDGQLKLIDVDGCIEIGTPISPTDSSISFSPCYCAPEFASFVLGREGFEFPALPGLDSWSVGCTLCELVSLEPIFVAEYIKFFQEDKHSGRAQFIDRLAKLETAPVPCALEPFDVDLLQLLTGWLLVCSPSERRTCAEALDAPYFTRSGESLAAMGDA